MRASSRMLKHELGVDADVHLAKEREQGVLTLHRDALERLLGPLGAEKAQDDGLVLAARAEAILRAGGC